MMKQSEKLLSGCLLLPLLLLPQSLNGFVLHKPSSMSPIFKTKIPETLPFVPITLSNSCLCGVGGDIPSLDEGKEQKHPNETNENKVVPQERQLKVQEKEDTKHQAFKVASNMLDVIGQVTTVVIGGGATVGLALNLCGYGFIFPSTWEDGFMPKIGSLQEMRTVRQMARSIASTNSITSTSKMSSTSSDLNEILRARI